MKSKIKWTSGKCRVAQCEMTMVMPIGGGQHLCWLHAIAFGLPLVLLACSADVFFSVEGGIVVGVDGGADVVDIDSAREDGATNDGATTSDADASSDAAIVDAAPDNNADACGQIWGATACDGIMSTYCQALYTCNGAMTVQQCKTWWAANFPADFDCAANKYKKQACAADPNKCANVEIPSYACGKLMSSTPSQLGGSCASFFAGF